jgi:hypothetical protein
VAAVHCVSIAFDVDNMLLLWDHSCAIVGPQTAGTHSSYDPAHWQRLWFYASSARGFSAHVETCATKGQGMKQTKTSARGNNDLVWTSHGACETPNVSLHAQTANAQQQMYLSPSFYTDMEVDRPSLQITRMCLCGDTTWQLTVKGSQF